MDTTDLTATIKLRDGRGAIIRPLEAEDVEALSAFFLGLSQRTKSRYGPHPFDRATAEKLCANIDNNQTIRFITLLQNEGKPQIIGYIILSREIWSGDRERYKDLILFDDTACFAPAMADAFQDQGVGSLMGRHVLASAHKIGLKRVILMGGVMAQNDIARHVYLKLGFRQLGEFITHQNGDVHNFDMMVEF